MKKTIIGDVLVVSFALFAMFLGAANIIFPPYIGALSGEGWTKACLGFILTGTGLPLLGVLATARAGGQPNDVPSRVSPQFSKIFITILILIIGPAFCVPRTAATTIELSLIPFLPTTWPTLPVMIIGCLVFFLICLFFVLSPGNALDRIGRFLTPMLITFLLGLIIWSVVRPVGQPVATDEAILKQGLFHFGFTTGYQTMDALASILLSTTVFSSLMAKGYSKAQTQKMMVPVALISGFFITVVYGGFIWIGASGSASLQSIKEFSALTVSAVHLLAGVPGRIILAIIIFLACCTTAVGLIMTASEYFTTLFKGKISYRTNALVLTAISYVISIMGVEGIIQLASPMLEVMYPAVIVLIVLNLFGQHIKGNEAFIGGMIGTLPASFLNVLRLYDPTRPMAERYLVFFPLGEAGFGSFIPAIIGALIGLGISVYRQRRKSGLQP